MANDVYIVIGNHRSVLGINEIVYCLHKSLSKTFSVKLTQRIKNNCVNILIDEFSNGADLIALEHARQNYPKTKFVIVATEFVTPVSMLGVDLGTTFNFFGGLRKKIVVAARELVAPVSNLGIKRGTTFESGGLRVLRAAVPTRVRSLLGRGPNYMQQRYAGFVRALKCCDLLVSVHREVQSGVDELLRDQGLTMPSVMVYPEFGPLSGPLEDRLLTLPFGFLMTGTITPFRRGVMTNIVNSLRRLNCREVPFGESSFDNSASAFPPYNTKLYDSSFSFTSTEADYLFNINPPQTEEWRYSSPMRIYRAVMRGQIPIITRKFGDHPIEEVATLWDGNEATALSIGMMKLSDRTDWLADFERTLEKYDQVAHEGNEPFVNAIVSLEEASGHDVAAQ